MTIKKFQEFLNESIRSLSQPELFNWLKERSDYTFIALDTETTGLRGPKEEQLTQIAAVAFGFDYETLAFSEISAFNEKIALNPEIVAQMDQPGSRIRDVFKFTGYEINQDAYRAEQEVLDSLQEFVDGFGDVILMIQNAPFDMPMINVRKKFGGLRHEIFDTKEFFAYFLLPTLQKLAETDEEARSILKAIGTTGSGKLPSSSLPKVSSGMGIDNSGAHDALFDCRYMMLTLQKALEIVSKHPDLELKDYVRDRVLMDRKIKLKDRARRKGM
jgi:DNA polymerase III epsilon subunit-like protein